ncbi:uncharacterized protein [Littorina saxatilis]|uniref:uncharacterized protein isoform X2 n=1 Tax=Littorina saxatilis TaxID=31220 RepID=UPI0038B50D13
MQTTRMEQPYTPTPSTGCKDRGGEPSIVTIPFVVLVVLLIVAVIVIVILVVCLCRQRSHRSDGANGAGVILNTRVKARGQGIALYVTPANTQHVPIGPPERHTWGSPQNDLSAVSSGHYEEMDFSLPVGKKSHRQKSEREVNVDQHNN